MKIALLSLSLMVISCKPFDPAKCPVIELVNNPHIKEVYASQISCSFQKMCLVKYDGLTHKKTCKEQ